MQRIPPRTIAFICLVWLIVGGAILLKERSFRTFVESTAQIQMEADRDIWNIIHDLSDKALVHAIIDHTFWDEMVDFVEGRLDEQWAHDNLDPGLDSFGLDALWALQTDGTVRYSVFKSTDGLVAAPSLPLDLEALRRMMTTRDSEFGNTIHEFYWFSDVGPMLLFVSEITTTDDPGHEKPGRGYYVITTLISHDASVQALAEIGAKGEAQRMTTIPPEQPPGPDGPHVFWHPMTDYTGATIGAIRIERLTGAFKALLSSDHRSRTLTTALWLLVGIAVSALLLTLNRTQHRAQELAGDITEKLRETNVGLERKITDRTADLEEDIARRKATEDQLRARTSELERANKMMLDRELGILELKKGTGEPEKPGSVS